MSVPKKAAEKLADYVNVISSDASAQFNRLSSSKKAEVDFRYLNDLRDVDFSRPGLVWRRLEKLFQERVGRELVRTTASK